MFLNEGAQQAPVYERVHCIKGIVDPVFKKKHNLSSSSKPQKFVDAFLLLHKPKGKGLFPTEEAKNVPDFQGDFQTLAIWTNIKAKLAGAVPGGNYYSIFKDFTGLEIHQHNIMFICILNCL